MKSETMGLRHQHDRLHAGVAMMVALRDDLGTVSRAEAGRRLDEVLRFLRHEVAPHARAEEEVLYPEVARLLNIHVTAMLVRDHRQIARLVEDISVSREALRGAGSTPAELPGLLTALADLMDDHLREEEEVLLPALDSELSAAETYALYERMETAVFNSLVGSRPGAGPRG